MGDPPNGAGSSHGGASDDPRASIRPDPSDAPEPPPPVPRRIHVEAWRMFAIGLIAIVPLLALWGLFGIRIETASAVSNGLRLTAQFPSCFRLKQVEGLEVRAINASPAPLDNVVVRFDDGYMLAFSRVDMVPQPARAFEVELGSIEPGGSRLIAVQIQAVRYGRHAGTIRATADGGRVAAVNITTTVYP